MSRIALVGIDRQIYLVNADGSGLTQLTAPMPQGTGAWSLLRARAEAWSWPTWSPDGAWIACFAVAVSDEGTGPVRVVTLAVDGVREVEWAAVQGMAPLYLQWHPTGAALTVLLQQDEELVLHLLARRQLGQLRPIEHGVPLFFSWSATGDRLLVHAGDLGGGDGRLVLRDPLGTAEDVIYADRPGSFCAPVFVGGRAIYAARGSGGQSVVMSAAPDGTDARPVLTRRGLLAILPAPRGAAKLAISHAPRGEGSPYLGIELVDLGSGETRRLTNERCLAYFWAPTGDWLLLAQADRENNCVRWFRVAADGSGTTPLASFWPTRDLLFYLHFFDQYGLSHNLVSADGRRLVYAGYPAGGGQADLSAPPRVWVKDTGDTDAPPVEVARGSFAVYAPGE